MKYRCIKFNQWGASFLGQRLDQRLKWHDRVRQRPAPVLVTLLWWHLSSPRLALLQIFSKSYFQHFWPEKLRFFPRRWFGPPQRLIIAFNFITDSILRITKNNTLSKQQHKNTSYFFRKINAYSILFYFEDPKERARTIWPLECWSFANSHAIPELSTWLCLSARQKRQTERRVKDRGR